MKPAVRRGALTVGIALVVAALLPSYIRAYTISGDSDAPAYVSGDRVLVNLAAYDLRTPYSSMVLTTLREPRPGDMVLFRMQDGQLAIKRVVAGPGGRVAMQDNHLVVDGCPLQYLPVSEQERSRISRGLLGSSLELEQGNGSDVYVSYTPSRGAHGSFEPVQLPEDMFFLLGSNRDVSTDSRDFGLVHRNSILGRVVGRGSTAG